MGSSRLPQIRSRSARPPFSIRVLHTVGDVIDCRETLLAIVGGAPDVAPRPADPRTLGAGTVMPASEQARGPRP